MFVDLERMDEASDWNVFRTVAHAVLPLVLGRNQRKMCTAVGRDKLRGRVVERKERVGLSGVLMQVFLFFVVNLDDVSFLIIIALEAQTVSVSEV